VPYASIEDRRSYQNAYHKRRYREDTAYRKAYIARARKRDERTRLIVDAMIKAFKLEGCLACEEDAPCCLVAHHIQPSGKDFHIAHARGKKIGVRRIKLELAKCVCLCANCHSKLHAKVLKLATLKIKKASKRCTARVLRACAIEAIRLQKTTYATARDARRMRT
jgi:hypothetical protein